MKGVKCIGYQKLFIILAVLFVPLFILLNTSNASAASLGTSSFDLYYSSIGESYQWRNNITYGNSSPTVIDPGGGVQRYQFNTTSIQAGGNYASLHFETNIVSSSYRNLSSYNPWVNLQQQNILTCSANGISVVTKNLSYVTTYWTNSDGANNTLTFYGDLTLSGFNQNQSYTLVCAIGSSSYSFISSGAVWFEQNPMSITWFNDESIAILQTQTNQNNTIINQNQTIIDQDNQDRSDLQNTSDNAESDAQQLGQGVTQASSSLILIIGNFISTVLNPPQSDCVIDGNMGNMDLGNIDLCSLSPPPAFSIIGSFIVLGMLIPLVLACIFKFISFLRLVTGGK